MKKLLFILAALIAFSSFTAVSADNNEGMITAKFLYVSPTGSDSAAGTSSAPFATIQKAISAAREYDSTVVINLRSGEYKVSEAIKLTSADSNLVIRGIPGEEVIITSGNDIPYSAFSPVTDNEFLNRLSDTSVKRQIVSASLPELGITEYGEIKLQGMGAIDKGFAPTLSYNDQPLTIARYPNNDYLTTETVVFDGMSGDNYFGSNSLCRGEFTTTDKRYRSWDKDGDAWVFGYFKHDWADVTSPCDFSENDTLYTYVSKNYGVTENRRFYFFNIPEEIDAPGEWYLDRTTGMLYLYPTNEMKTNGGNLLFAAAQNNIIEIENSNNISIENLKIEGTCGSGITVSDSDSINVYCCEFTSIGNNAVYMRKTANSGADSCYFHDLGSRGIYFADCGDKATLTASNCYVKNSEFERFQNYRRTYAPAIQANECVGVNIAHNNIHNAPHFAISYITNDTIIEYNNIYDVCKETRDCGAVYTGRRWDTWGNIFRYNYVHDMLLDDSATTTFGVYGIYLDDMSAQTEVFGNVFAKLPSAALIGGGRNNQFTNNLIIDCTNEMSYDQRAAETPDPSASGYTIYDGVAYSWDVTSCFEKLKSSYYLSDVWKAKYTGYSQWPNSAQQNMLNDEPQIPKYAIVKNNAKYNTGASKISKLVSTYGDVQNTYEMSKLTQMLSPFFADYSKKDYTLTSKGLINIRKTCSDFQDIPFKQMGQTAYVYENKYVSEMGILSSSVTQSTYTKYKKDEQTTAVSKHSIYAYARFTGTNSDIEKCGFKITNEKGITIDCPMLSVPAGDAYAVKFVGAGIKAGTYTIQSYINGKDGKVVYGEIHSVTLDPKLLVGVANDPEKDVKVTTYEIEAFK